MPNAQSAVMKGSENVAQTVVGRLFPSYWVGAVSPVRALCVANSSDMGDYQS